MEVLSLKLIYADASIYRVGHQSRDGDYPVGCGLDDVFMAPVLLWRRGDMDSLPGWIGLCRIYWLPPVSCTDMLTGTIHALQIQVALAVLVQAISLAGAFELQVLLERGNVGDFMDSVSLRLVFGILCWIILLQWYRMNRTDESDFEEISGTEADKGQEEAVPAGETFLDRVSVKDGSRIHIIHLEELLYLQAGGDYVTIFTPGGQYVKEQTMKYFETHLPPALFVRIHRSCIVNTEQILRVELFGKENYQVRLKNGVCLRASNAGYKLLKERLSL